MVSPKADAPAGGKLAVNILYFARALRQAGLPVGPGAALDALAAVEAAGIGNRGDFYATLHAVFVKRREHSALFDQAFRLFWKRRGFLEKLIAMMSPRAEVAEERRRPEPGAARIAEALFKTPRDEAKTPPSLELDARLTMSPTEVLQTKDFAQMSVAEIAEARALIAKLRLPVDETKTRRSIADPRGVKVDPRRSFRRSLKAGGSVIDLALRAPALRHPPIVVLCDISGSMSEYTRVFLHFIHALSERRTVSTFLFGTRLTNVTRALRSRDVDEALDLCSNQVKDWSGGTRIASALHEFNRAWSRRVLGQGAIVLLFTDGLERDDQHKLGFEIERLRKSCRRLIWVNPLLRYDSFEAKALGIRAMLPHVDEFRPIHNIVGMVELCRALSRDRGAAADPRDWLKLAG